MSIFNYFKKKKSLIGNDELIKKTLAYQKTGLEGEQLFEEVRKAANIEFAQGNLDKIPSTQELNDLIKLIQISQPAKNG